ncbi:FAD:protein FMN transferase [Sphingomonas japonica]|uniref:FAD:protein FMN transferase n=1 Tax=Sphingomonas japonica TaxID=511662 RepID=UPI001FD1E9EA|nr:FAD:protein FMN transferase [Sphingomonas japonica]
MELHVFGAADDKLLGAARRAIEAVDDALTIHRPSPTTALNECLRAGGSAVVTNRELSDALLQIADGHMLTHGWFDPVADAQETSARWSAIASDRDGTHVSASHPVALDFGGFGKGFALDRACAVLRDAGVVSALLSAGESSIAVIGEHPLGGAWPFAVPHPLDPDTVLIELELVDEALSISSTVGAGTAAPERSAMIRPGDGAIASIPRTAIAIDQLGARAEMISTGLLVADKDDARRLLADGSARRFLFDFADEAAMPVHLSRISC